MREQRALRDRMQARIDVVVDARHEHVDRHATGAAQPLDDLRFALQAMCDQARDFGLRVLDHRSVAGRDARHRLALQPRERIEVLLHVAVRRSDHDRRALHDVIAREQQAGAFEQVTKVIRRVAGRMNRAQLEISDGNDIAVVEHVGRSEGCILAAVLRRGATEHVGSGEVCERRHRRRMIRMRARRQDRGHATPHCCDDPFDVHEIVRPGSMTAQCCLPTRYVLVPGPVMNPGLRATRRRTPVAISSNWPEVSVMRRA